MQKACLKNSLPLQTNRKKIKIFHSLMTSLTMFTPKLKSVDSVIRLIS